MEPSLTWWIATAVLVILLLSADLLVTGRQQRPPTAREAAAWVGGYCAVALLFGAGITVGFGAEYGGQFVAGWLTEYSLSVDNLFVFLVLMARFAVPPALQLRVLTIGIVLALVLRGLMIAVGVAVIARYSWVFLFFGAFLLWTAWGLVRGGDEHQPSAEPNRLVRLIERVVPTTPQWQGARFFTREQGRRVLTPMAITMVAIGTTDVLFALDSIPAIFGLTREPFLVVAANAFALMGLRQLYFLVGGLIEKLPLLSVGLALVLAFIGVKLVLEALAENTLPFLNGGRPVEAVPHISVAASLGVVIGTLLVTTLAGLALGRRNSRRLREAGRAGADTGAEDVRSAT
jgi:tellurite resistance protein TerC